MRKQEEHKDSLIIFTKAALMLAEADTIQKAKELKNLALTAADWAKRKGMGEEAIRYARSYALEAERKMGEMLTDKNLRQKPGEYQKSQDVTFDPKPSLADLGLTKNESSRAQKLSRLPREKFDEILTGEIPLVSVIRTHVTHNSGENEWFTPPDIIEAARKVMGGIDCDPASCTGANEIVGAKKYFTTDDDGLKQKWAGRIWMNPPYSQSKVSDFAEAVSAKYESGEISQACILVNNATETAWFQRMLMLATEVCFVRGRIKFIDQKGEVPGGPLQGQVIIYFGENRKKFHEVFCEKGIVLDGPGKNKE